VHREAAYSADTTPASRVISRDQLYELLAHAMKTRPVMGPMERTNQPGFTYFDWLDSPEQFVADYITTTMPPKKAFFAPSQVLFSFELDHPPKLIDAAEDSPFIVAGVHPCDLAAVDELDTAYGYPPIDRRWQHERKRGTIIGIDCKPDEYCFCTTVGTCAARKPCDLFLTRIERGFLAQVYTSAGDDLLKPVKVSKPSEQDLRDAKNWLDQKTASIVAQFDVSIPEFAEILDEGGLTEVWQDVANRCYSCGNCNIPCPTCFCFDMVDDVDLTMKHGVRRRSWDSCQLPHFAVVAGPHNFREDRWQRVRHRWHRKFLYLYRKYGRPYCTGCGRCSRACIADINIVDVSNQLIKYAQTGELE